VIAMRLHRISEVGDGSRPLRLEQVPDRDPKGSELRIRVLACGVCRTELDEIEGRTPPPRLPVIPGHQVVGRVEAVGPAVGRYRPGDRVGVGWIAGACGDCAYCASGRENLCPRFRAAGRDVDGGYAEAMIVQEGFAHPIPASFSDVQAAPLLCAGAVGYRALKRTGLKDGLTLGLSGFGASAHLVLQWMRCRMPGSAVFVFSRNALERDLALRLGAAWAGDFSETPPEAADAWIDTTPAWRPVLASLANLKPGGRLVINAIRKEDGDREAMASLDYAEHLWMEKEILSVANVTRSDVAEFLPIAAECGIRPEVREYPLEDANRALADLKQGGIPGAKVLRPRQQ
jgi:alcohol dehydrogenase, propanol-preferring